MCFIFLPYATANIHIIIINMRKLKQDNLSKSKMRNNAIFLKVINHRQIE